jgi:GH15 family glucan-1,4-alpha-glucosidase
MGRRYQIQRPLVRDGTALGSHAEAAHTRPHWCNSSRANDSLPEEIGGVRNWDYRYSWIRDAAFTVYGFVRLVLTHEAEQFMRWVEQRTHEANPDGSLQVLYGINGEHDLPEVELPHLEGYKGSAPVRIGNKAASQLQLDIYGELLDSAYLANKYGKPISYDAWQHLRGPIDYVEKHWLGEGRGDLGDPR